MANISPDAWYEKCWPLGTIRLIASARKSCEEKWHRDRCIIYEPRLWTCIQKAAMIEKDGTLKGVLPQEAYSAMIRWSRKKYIFAPGDLDSRHGIWMPANSGTLICGIMDPEASSSHAKCKERKFCSTQLAIGLAPKEKAAFRRGAVSAWETMRAREISNGVQVAAVKSHRPWGIVGRQESNSLGHSFICDPFGRNFGDGQSRQRKKYHPQSDPALIADTRRTGPSSAIAA